MAWIRREILPHAVASTPLDHGIAFDLVAAPGLEAKLDELIRLERECCSRLRIERKAGGEPGRLRLEVHGLDPGAPSLRSLRLPRARLSRRTRLVRAAGAGLLSSLVVCCVLPAAAAAVLGATVLPIFASLDGPLPIAAGALLGGALAWRRLGRREEARGESLARGCHAPSTRRASARLPS
jgi:hypothetical protein